MSKPTEPWDLAEAFVAALEMGDVDGVAECCSPDAWVAEVDSPARLARDVTERGLKVETGDVDSDGERAVAEILVRHPSRPDRPRTVRLLLVHDGTGWEIDGLSLGDLHADAFLAGKLSARPIPAVVPEEGALDGLSRDNRVGRRFALRQAQVAAAGGTIRVVSARAFTKIDRAELVVRTELPDHVSTDAWLYVDLLDGTVLAEDSHPSWGSFFAARADEVDDAEAVPEPPDFE